MSRLTQLKSALPALAQDACEPTRGFPMIGGGDKGGASAHCGAPVNVQG